MTPGEIAVLLEAHVYGNAEDCHNMKHDMSHSGMFTKCLLDQDLIKLRDTYAADAPDLWAENAPPPYTTTQRGIVHIGSLCRIPLPQQEWTPGDIILEQGAFSK